MCGIVALAWGGGSPPPRAHRAAAAAAALRSRHARRGPDGANAFVPPDAAVAVGAAVLHMRPGGEWRQPAEAGGVVVAWNGEWYDDADSATCDTPRVARLVDDATRFAETADEALALLAAAFAARVRGPYAFVAWVPRLRLLAFGRDPFGRRSLLLRHAQDVLAVSSVALEDDGAAGCDAAGCDWTEVASTGLFGVEVADGAALRHLDEAPWPRPLLLDRVGWPKLACDDSCAEDAGAATEAAATEAATTEASRLAAAEAILAALSDAVRRRVVHAPGVAVLFSGGIDSVMIAALAHRHAPIELINAAFGADGARDARSAPDRIAARLALLELRRCVSAERR
ncbi:hypothetical protein M885DRAFT_575083 [Pelagophyceae sp. CCMP2097]|nr:hypothetical protein M885DRAFT_575083 [Pelagophyceae sp. CCMP2097]